MRELPLIGLLLLPTTALASAPSYQVRHATTACVTSAALASRAHAGCFKVSAHRRWKHVGRRGHGIVLMQAVPPLAGEPPLLYFRTTSLARVRGLHPRHSAAPAAAIVTEAATVARTAPAAVVTLEPLAATALLRSPPPAAPPSMTRTLSVRSRPASHPALVLLVWLLIIGAAALLVRFVLIRKRPAPVADPEQRPAIDAHAPASSMTLYKSRCVDQLRHAGWDARTRFSAGLPGPDVVARSNGLVLALQCHASRLPVDVGAVEQACMARERQQSDLAAIVSNAPFTDAARQLAERTGIVLLHEDELASFAT